MPAQLHKYIMHPFPQYGANPNVNISSSERADNLHSHHPRCGAAAPLPGGASGAASAAATCVLYHYVRLLMTKDKLVKNEVRNLGGNGEHGPECVTSGSCTMASASGIYTRFFFVQKKMERLEYIGVNFYMFQPTSSKSLSLLRLDRLGSALTAAGSTLPGSYACTT